MSIIPTVLPVRIVVSGGLKMRGANPESILKASSSAACLALAFDPRRNVNDAPANKGSKRRNQQRPKTSGSGAASADRLHLILTCSYGIVSAAIAPCQNPCPVAQHDQSARILGHPAAIDCSGDGQVVVPIDDFLLAGAFAALFERYRR